MNVLPVAAVISNGGRRRRNARGHARKLLANLALLNLKRVPLEKGR